MRFSLLDIMKGVTKYCEIVFVEMEWFMLDASLKFKRYGGIIANVF